MYPNMLRKAVIASPQGREEWFFPRNNSVCDPRELMKHTNF